MKYVVSIFDGEKWVDFAILPAKNEQEAAQKAFDYKMMEGRFELISGKTKPELKTGVNYLSVRKWKITKS